MQEDNPCPTQEEIAEFVRTHAKAIVYEIKRRFNQFGTDTMLRLSGDRKKAVCVSFGATRLFNDAMGEFMQREDVCVGLDMLACLISDGERWSGEEKFAPLVFTMK